MRTTLRLMAVATLLTLLGGMAAPRPASATPVWWNSAWAMRAELQVSTQDAIANGYAVSLTFPHNTLVAAGNSLSNGNDIRVVRWNGTTWTELDRMIDPHYSWNSSSTRIWFRTQTALGASTTDKSYWLYYNNANAGAPPANGNNIFDLFDDFSEAAIDANKWSTWDYPPNYSHIAGGELVAAATNTSGDPFGFMGVQSVDDFTSGFIAESDFKIVSQSVYAWENWKGQFGTWDSTLGIDSDDAWSASDKLIRYWDGNDWVDYADSSLDARTFSWQHMATSVDASGTARFWENGVLKATRNGVGTSPNSLIFTYGPDGDNETFEARFDNIIVRKYVANEPSVSMGGVDGAEGQVSVGVAIDPSLTFTVAGKAASSSCNGATSDVTSTNASVALGSASTGANRTASQDLSVETNAASGYTVYLRSSGPLASATHNMASWAGTNATPTLWSSTGTESIGYTTDSSALSGTADRFTNGGPKWAGLTTSNGEVEHSSSVGSTTICVAYRLGISSLTPAGVYTTSVIYTVTPAF